ncbi:MAG: hypothetical protein US94_C0033G0007 [Berkelbacteria bacterium GW2011_GWB1_38_5]|uniref:PD-(D/E)XK endonuclease-like domain-containing protein n=2 Tax=Candidatus Berkelbacteria TaxID=1618330 RepID=A0A0G0LEM3_9BACT|nr:MAG: hypothetical protein US94_C0033G0007 [Berkelbacteria bacterium GW2011_GWB1_38_5]KKQ90328.1 MAG: hypothetical protein UT15_C0015G0001 [Berkelbacteria bacterium GW2011_GWA1_39_10]
MSMRISFSAFDTFSRCPLKYKFSYIDRIPIAKKPELEFGSLIHGIVENALKREPIIPAIEETLKLYDEGFKNITSFADDRQKDQYYPVGKEIIKTFYKTLTPGLQDTIATEKRFYIQLNDKHTLSGAIDRIDKLPFGAYEVIDYKTNFKPKTQQDIDKDKQLGFYNIAIKELWPDAEDVRLSMYFLKPDLKLTTTRQDDEIDALKEEIIETAEKIENEKDYLPKENNFCDWCDYQHLCPLKKQKVAPEKEEDVEMIFEEYILAQQKMKDLEPKIHNHFDKEKIEKYHHKKGVVSRSQENKKLSVRKN